ncbi:MAG: GNAT family N-acetyltransferase [Marmoricola sp.]
MAGDEVVLETDRLLLRGWRLSDAAVQRELWAERDPRVPPHRRIDAHGRPTLKDLEEWIRDAGSSARGLLVVERKGVGDVIGYCGLVDSGRAPDEPELALELLQRCWGQGYATQAAEVVVSRARTSGHRRLWATVWDWNTGSRRVLEKIGFVEVEREQATYGTNVVTTLAL